MTASDSGGEERKNLFSRLEKRLPEELTEILLSGRGIRVERIVSDGHTTGWYDQEENEWVCLLEGEADLEIEGEIQTLQRGEFLLIPRHCRHRVTRTTKCIWLCIFFD